VADASKLDATVAADRASTGDDAAVIAQRQAGLDAAQKAAADAREKELAPLEAGIAQAEGAPLPPREKVEMPTWERPKVDPQQFQQTAMSLLAMALIGGVASKGNWMGASSSLQGAMEGYAEGNQEKAQQAFEDYKAKFAEAKEHEQQANKEMEDILRDRTTSINQKIALYKAAAAKYDRQDARLQADQRSIDGMWKALESRKSSLDRLEAQNQRFTVNLDFKETQAARKAAGGGGAGGLPPGFDEEKIDYYARQALAGDQSWRTGLARSKQGVAIIAAVDARIPDLARENEISPEEASTTKDQRHALARALDDRQKYVAAANQFIGNFNKQTDLVRKYLRSGVGGATPVFNRWIQSGRKNVAGDPEVTQLDAAIRGLAREHQRIVTGVTANGQLHDSAAKTADELLNIDMTAGQIEHTLTVMHEEAQNALAAGREETGALRKQLNEIGVAGKQASKSESGAPKKLVYDPASGTFK